MKRKFIRDVSVNTFQVIINQVCGVVIFYVLSIHFSKEDFGGINWALAVLLTAFSILSFGIDQVFIKKIASGIEAKQLLSVYLIHVLLAGCMFYGLLLLGRFFFSDIFHQHYLLLFLGIGKLAIFFSTPFKLLANGLEKFKALLYMSTCSNIIRSIALIVFSIAYPLGLHTVIIIFIAGDIAELLLCLIITRAVIKIPIAIHWDKKNYFDLIKESIPLGGVAIFTSAIARFDWIFLGLLTSNIMLAEYSFAYKAFEMAILPLLVIAPVLIPRFTKFFHSSTTHNDSKKRQDLFILLRIEIIIASMIALILNIVWVPVVDLITNGKYGAADHYIILILSACMPLLYLNNFLWTIHFAKGHFKQIFYIIAISFIINITGDIILILFFKAEGAAFAYLLSLFVQAILYWRNTKIKEIKKITLFFIPVIAICSGLLSTICFNNTWMILGTSLLIFTITLFISRQIRQNDWLVFKRITGL